LGTAGIAMRYRKKKFSNEPKTKICACCGKEFSRKKQTIHQFRVRKYCSRACTYKGNNRSYTYTKLIDACNKFIDQARDEAMKDVKVYSCKTMSQAELQKLIPSTKQEIRK